MKRFAGLIVIAAGMAQFAQAQCSEPRYWMGTWSSGATYGICNAVFYANSAYVSAQAANTGHQPDTSPAWWTLLYSAPVVLQTGEPMRRANIALNYNLAWLRANGGGGGVSAPPGVGMVRADTGLLSVQASIFNAGIESQAAVNCTRGTTASIELTAAANLQEITIIPAVSGAVLYTGIVISESTQFTGAVGLTVCMGRPGVSTRCEMTGGPFTLGVSSGDTHIFNGWPNTPQGTGTYPIVLTFQTAAGNVNAAAAGVMKWKICGYLSE